MRLIDADALTAKELEQKEYWMSRGHGDGGTDIVLGALEQAPTVPAEVVVHCRNCNWFEREDRAFDSCDGWCKYFRYAVHDDAFCSYGERRESEAGK